MLLRVNSLRGNVYMYFNTIQFLAVHRGDRRSQRAKSYIKRTHGRLN